MTPLDTILARDAAVREAAEEERAPLTRHDTLTLTAMLKRRDTAILRMADVMAWVAEDIEHHAADWNGILAEVVTILSGGSE